MMNPTRVFRLGLTLAALLTALAPSVHAALVDLPPDQPTPHVRTDQELDSFLATLPPAKRPSAICDEMRFRFGDDAVAAMACAARVRQLGDKTITLVTATSEQVFVTRKDDKGHESVEQIEVGTDDD